MTTEKRKYRRANVSFSVSFDLAGTPASGTSRDVSLGGMFIETQASAPFQSTLTVRLHLPNRPAPIPVQATVRWITKEGMGVQFGVMGARDTHALTELLAQ